VSCQRQPRNWLAELYGAYLGFGPYGTTLLIDLALFGVLVFILATLR
jgi:hypothetical protein